MESKGASIRMAAHAIRLDRACDTRPSDVEAEDRILRLWTPILLRTVLAAAVVLMIAGIFRALTTLPAVGTSALLATSGGRMSLVLVVGRAVAGDADALATLGLMALTLVPLVRVAFCFLLFLKQRSMVFVAFTAYVLAALTLGMLLGKIG